MGVGPLWIYNHILSNDVGWVSAVNAKKRAWERAMAQFLGTLNSLEEGE